MEKVTIGNAELYLGDCLDILPQLEKVDALITDPPYGLKIDPALRKRTGRNKLVKDENDFEPIIGDDKPFNPAHLLNYKKVILWGGNHYCDKLPGKPHWLIWDKRCLMRPVHNADYELAWSNLTGPARIFYHVWRGMIRGGAANVAKEYLVHPAQKPIELMAWCFLQAKIAETDIVCDPYMGSGTLGVSAMNHGCRYIGIEIERKYFDIACERIERSQQQMRLAI